MNLIDTDVAIDLLRGYGPAHSWLRSLPPSESTALSGYSVIELMEGTENLRQMRSVQQWALQFEVLWLSHEGCKKAADVFASRKLSHNVSSFDCFIGSTAVEHETVLYTFNAKHMGVIPEISIAQPYTRS